MVDSSEKGSADIIKSDSGRVFVTQRTLVGMQTVWSSILHLSIWLCVLSRYVSDINVGKINQRVVCGSTTEVLLTNARIILRLKNVEFDSHLAHSRELQSLENCSLITSKFRERHTGWFESALRNRVHVETASISLRRRSLRYRRAAFKENNMIENELIIGLKTNGKYYVRPLNWAGCWGKDGKLEYGNTLFEADTEEEVKAYADGFRAGKTWK